MQSTLLTIGIAIIFALLAALIGPLFIDWEGYRSTVEAEASRVFGATVNVTGPIEVRLLPTPSAKLAGVELRGTEFAAAGYGPADRDGIQSCAFVARRNPRK